MNEEQRRAREAELTARHMALSAERDALTAELRAISRELGDLERNRQLEREAARFSPTEIAIMAEMAAADTEQNRLVAEAFIHQKIEPKGIASAEAFGTPGDVG